MSIKLIGVSVKRSKLVNVLLQCVCVVGLGVGVSGAVGAHVNGGGWPSDRVVTVAYNDLTAIGAVPKVEDSAALIADDYDVIIYGFADKLGKMIGRGQYPVADEEVGYKRLLSLGGDTYHFSDQGDPLGGGDIIDVEAIVKVIVDNKPGQSRQTNLL